ncbi:hypothetical protein DEU56DRAFT_870535 [Suillus clintonianus]|uniref:uncharacterized protein n=1 Tax=Suillus clintonianus TaxID=1904413 RepID=UPI001B87E19B|nr:uncharacterized protein DEU56DRAFT_870535 [Suillus clintonianus]KAG2142988.1 hypothetical protein DEU56DRAFT_870535 [Suillus clintonianus]
MHGSSPRTRPRRDDIKVEYHPHSKLPSTVHHFADFSRKCPTEDSVPRSTSPWEPFRTRLDFEIAEIALEAAMTKEQTNRLIDLVHRSANGQESFTLQNHNEVRSFWAMASERFTPFQVSVVSVAHRDDVHDFNMHYRPLWDWALDLLRDSRFAKHFVFDAQRLYKFNGERFVRFFDEPWTANSFWEAQSQLPPDAKPLAFILYADKSKLSSFGTQKGYLIISLSTARIANLPVEIRNGTGVAGGRVVGWLPIVNEDKMQSRKQSFVNFKNAVWHKSFFLLLEAVIQHSKTGYWLDCGDMIRRFLWPLILILSADYEEQCVMALIRGLKGKFPCPICLVPQDMQAVFSEEHVLRTNAQSQQTLEITRAASTKKAREAHLKAFSLRDVECVFWLIRFCDIHHALSWDRLHTSGLWSDHLWEELHFWLAELGREAAAEIDTNMDALPRWPNLRHFVHVIKIDFSDGSVHEDISRMIIFAAQNILTPTESENGYLLLRCICLFVEFDIYASLEVHTEDTIATRRETLCKFVVLLDEYITKSVPETGKNWNFPKKHSNAHVFDDILAKGTTQNYNTKPSKKMHGPLRAIYLRFILCYDHWLFTLTSMRSKLDDLDEYIREKAVNPEEAEEPQAVALTAHTHLGLKRGDLPFSQIEQEHATDRAFLGFRIRLNNFLNEFLPQHGIPLPNGKRVHFRADDQVAVYQFLRVNYDSVVDWYDCVMVNTEDRPFFAHLIYLFCCSVGDTVLSLALVHPYNVGIGQRRRRDIELGLYHVRAKPHASPELISVDDPSAAGDYFIMDTIDADMFLRMKSFQVHPNI